MNRRAELRRAPPLATALALGLACLLPHPAQSSGPPRLTVKLIDPNVLEGMDQQQAEAINDELNELERHLPGIEVDAHLLPSDDFDYRLSRLVMESKEDELALTARYEGPEGFKDSLTGRFRDSCTVVLERDGRCQRRSVADRAAGVVADLLEQTLINWSTGIYRPFDVVRCRKHTLQQVSVKLASTSKVASYQDPDSWFRYRPSVLHQNASAVYPEPLELLLERRAKEGDGFIVFVRRQGLNEALDRFCPEEEMAQPGEARERIVLEHRYPGPEPSEELMRPLPVAVNATPPQNVP